MHHRRPFLRSLVVAGLVAAGLVAVVGGLALRGPGVVAVAVAGALAACLGWGTARESTAPTRRSNTEAAVLAAAWTVGVLLVLSGTSVLAGGVAAALLAGLAAVVALAVWVARTPKDDAARSAPPARPTAHGNVAASARPHPASARPALRPGDLPPVRTMTTGELGREWLESTAGLTARLDPSTRTAVVRRRQETLDELERRDPEGFQRWLMTGPVPGRDPADFVRKRTAGEPAAGTDAA